jgi:hypothetical protein
LGVAIITRPTPINQDASLVAYEFIGKSPNVAGVQPSAAAADHGHAMSSNPAQPIGFGLQQNLSVNGLADVAQGFAGGLTNGFLAAMTEWTIEGFANPINVNTPSDGAATGIGFNNNESNPASMPSEIVVGLNLTNNGLSAVPNFRVGSDYVDIPNTNYSHWAISCDSNGARCYWDGQLVGTLPSISTPAAQFGFGIQAGTDPENYPSYDLDEIRGSSVARYSGSSFTVPTEPFVSDGSTVLLWHLDNSPLGQWRSFPAGQGYELYTGVGSFTFEDSSGNGNVGYLAGGSPSGATCSFYITGAISTCSPTPSGRVANNMVLSVNARTGDLVLADAAGNPIGTAVPQSDGTTQIQLALSGGGPGDPWSWLVSPVN